MSELVISEFEKVAHGIYIEGLAVDYERNVVWYSDVIAGGIHGLKMDGSITSLNPERMWTGGILVNHDGCVLSSGQGGIKWNDPQSGKSGWLLHEIDGKEINGINEMVPDGEGGIFFGTTDIEMVVRGEATRPTQIYRLTVDRKLIKLIDGIGFSNGLMYDAARSKFYCNDTFHGTWIFDVQPDLTLINQRMLIEKEDADGMALDAKGNLWITGFRSGFLVGIAPDGSQLSPVDIPAGAITQVRFGGEDMRDVYINVVPSDGGDSLKDGDIPTEKRSFMLRSRSSVPGKILEPTFFQFS